MRAITDMWFGTKPAREPWHPRPLLSTKLLDVLERARQIDAEQRAAADAALRRFLGDLTVEMPVSSTRCKACQRPSYGTMLCFRCEERLTWRTFPLGGDSPAPGNWFAGGGS